MNKFRLLGVLVLVSLIILSGCSSNDIVDNNDDSPLYINEIELDEYFEVEYGSTESEVINKLPEKVNVFMSDGSEKETEVAWEAPNKYDSDGLRLFYFKGNIEIKGITGKFDMPVIVRKEGEEPYTTVNLKNHQLYAPLGYSTEDTPPELYVEDLLEVNELRLEGLNEEEVNQIRYFINLDTVSFSHMDYIDPVGDLENIEELMFLSVEVNDFSFISNLQNIKKMRIFEVYNKLNDLTNIMFEKSSIEHILISNYNEKEKIDLYGIDQLENISYLGLIGVQAENLEKVSSLNKLKFFGLKDMDLNDLTFLKNLNYLDELVLVNINLDNIDFLTNFENLDTLNLSGNEISKINFISGLNNLEELNLSENIIEDISPLKNLSELKILNLKDNQIKDIDVLSELINLEYLNLGDKPIDHNDYYNEESDNKKSNYVSDITPLVDNTGLNSGDEIHIYNNKLDFDDQETISNIKLLEDRGVQVFYPGSEDGDNDYPTFN